MRLHVGLDKLPGPRSGMMTGEIVTSQVKRALKKINLLSEVHEHDMDTEEYELSPVKKPQTRCVSLFPHTKIITLY